MCTVVTIIVKETQGQCFIILQKLLLFISMYYRKVHWNKNWMRVHMTFLPGDGSILLFTLKPEPEVWDYTCLSYYYFLSYLLCFSKLLFGNASLLEAKLKKGKNNVRCWALIVKNTTWCCQNKPSQSSELQCCGCQKRGFKFLCMFSVAASINECHVLKKKKTSLNVLF